MRTEEQHQYSGPAHLERHAWKPGTSGNPNGRPRGSGITDRIRAILDETDGRGETVADRIARAGVKAAERGEFRFWKYLVDRIDGPVSAVDSSEGLRPLIVQFVEERDGDE